MFNSGYQFTVAERFLRYVQIDTQSDPQSSTHPSSNNQKDLSKLLADELVAMGIADAHTDEFGYVYATIPANTDKKVPVICFCSHVDTAPDCSGSGVKPIVHHNYNGGSIILPEDETQVLTPAKYPYLTNHIGKDIITASGTTLLGSDDKSGVAIIMDMAHYLLAHPEVKHGTIRILFTPDEEVGRGTDKLDMQKLGADFGYTLDGGQAGDLEDETFSADSAQITIHGVSAHPGYAKNKLVNALKLAGEILSALPKTEWSPETTSEKLGFVHPVHFSGIAEKATIEFIVRDFDTAQLAAHEQRLKKLAEDIVAQYAGATTEFSVKEQYRNMKELLDQYPQVIAYAKQAIERAGLQVRMESIRGGTDGSRLSFMGLPCPNLFTGMQGIHSKTEWVGIYDMQKAVETLVNLVQVWEQNS
jgi:tripeptide aminopeptidase